MWRLDGFSLTRPSNPYSTLYAHSALFYDVFCAFFPLVRTIFIYIYLIICLLILFSPGKTWTSLLHARQHRDHGGQFYNLCLSLRAWAPKQLHHHLTDCDTSQWRAAKTDTQHRTGGKVLLWYWAFPPIISQDGNVAVGKSFTPIKFKPLVSLTLFPTFQLMRIQTDHITEKKTCFTAVFKTLQRLLCAKKWSCEENKLLNFTFTSLLGCGFMILLQERTGFTYACVIDRL